MLSFLITAQISSVYLIYKVEQAVFNIYVALWTENTPKKRLTLTHLGADAFSALEVMKINNKGI